MKKQLLFVVMLMCSLSVMAVSLPKDSYNAYGVSAGSESYTSSAGATFVNTAVLGTYEGACNPSYWNQDISDCKKCCTSELMQCDMMAAGNKQLEEACMEQNLACHENCENPELGQPLDAPTAFLLALVAAYGAVAVYRKRMQQA